MNGYQRIMAALRGEPSDAIPIMLHNFMPAAREAGYSMRAYRENPAAIADTFIQAVERYGYDGIVVDVDTATLADAVGVPVDLPDDPTSPMGSPGSTFWPRRTRGFSRCAYTVWYPWSCSRITTFPYPVFRPAKRTFPSRAAGTSERAGAARSIPL